MNRFKLLICLFLFLLHVSCEEEEEVPKPKSGPMLALNSLIGVDSLIQINLSESTGTSDIKYISDAIVTAYKNDQKLGELTYRNNGTYVLPDNYLKSQENYQFTIAHPAFNKLYTSTVPPNKVLIDEVNLLINQSDGKTSFTLNFTDDSTKRNFYMILVKGILENDTQLIDHYSNDIVFEGNLAINETGFEQNMLRGSRSFSDENFQNPQVEISFYLLNNEVFENFKEYRIELYHLTKDYFNYERSFVSIENRSDLPFPNKTNLYSNVEGAFGILTSYALDYKTVSKQ
jgi:hypothetical protein